MSLPFSGYGQVATVFVTGTEEILKSSSDIIVPGLQSLLNENDCRVAESERDADYIIKVEAKAAKATAGPHNLYYCQSNVKVTLMDMGPGGKRDIIPVKGPNEGGADAHGACEAAFEAAVNRI